VIQHKAIVESSYFTHDGDFLVVCDTTFLSILCTSKYLCIKAEKEIVSLPFADDFDPLNLSNISQFMSILSRKKEPALTQERC
jgi:hypothetical protein